MKLPAPTSYEETLCLLQHYGRDGGLEALVAEVNWGRASPQQIVTATLCRRPHITQMEIGAAGRPLGEAFAGIVVSPEFRADLIKNVFDSFPAKQRLLFVHIPKCAGKDFQGDLAEQYPFLPITISHTGWTSEKEFLAILSRLYYNIKMSPGIFVAGHSSARDYVNRGYFRNTDKMFTLLREPFAMVLSLTNYAVFTIMNDPKMNRFDTRDWLASLGETSMPRLDSESDRLDLARRILRSPKVVGRNLICSFLGAGTAESTLSVLASTNIELCDMSRYNEWRKSAWGLPPSSERGASKQTLTRHNITAADIAYIDEITSEDKDFYGRFLNVYQMSSSPSVFGVDLARWLGAS